MSGGPIEQHRANEFIRECQNSATRKRAYISSRQNDNGNSKRELFIGTSMSAVALERSDLLSGIGDTDGHAAASQFTPEEFRMWETACTVEIDISAADLVVVLKVRIPAIFVRD